MDVRDLRWGILGTAGIAPRVIDGIRSAGAGVVRAVASRDLARARAFGDRHDIPLAFGAYADLLRSGEVDAIYNPLPNSMHAEWTIAALEAGLPVLCEKPFTPTLAEARAVAEVARGRGLPCVEAYMYRYHPLYDRLWQVLDGGAIGRVVSVDSRFTFKVDDESAIPASFELAGGALLDVGGYCVDLSRRVAAAEPVRVDAFARILGVDRTTHGLLEFPNGILARFECSIESDERQWAEILGTDGSLVLESPWFPGREEGRILLRRCGEEDQVIPTPGGDGYALEALDFARAVAGEAEPRWGVDDAVRNVAILDFLLQSARG